MEGEKGQIAKPEGQLFYDAFNVTPVGIALEDMEGRPLFVNPALCSMLGYSEDEMQSKHCVEFSPPEDAKRDWTLFQQLQKGLIDHYQMEKRFFRRDGSLMWGRLNISLLNHRPSPLVVALVEDITDTRNIQETLELATKQTMAVTRCSRDFRYLWANQGCAELIQRPLNQIIGHPIAEVLGDEAFESLRHHFERVLAGESFVCEEEVNYRSVGRRWISAAYTPTVNTSGVVDGWVAVLVDVTGRKMAQDRLKEYERAVEGVEEMIAVVDREYRYVIANDKFLKMRNMRREQVVGRFAYEVLNKGFFESVVKPKLDECFQGKVVKYETKYSYPEIGERDIFISYFPIEAASGIHRAVCIFDDITDLKRAEEALSDMTRKLIEAHEEERNRIARELHDDVGQRLTLLMLNLDRLGKGQTSPPELSAAIVKVREDLSNLAGDIQSLSHRLHSSKLEYFGLAKAAAIYCSELSEQHSVEIDLHSEDIPDDLSKENTLCLFRVLQEALQNAIKHSRAQRFDVSFSRTQSGMIGLTVHDSGIGFDPVAAIKGRGLGLISMKERLKLVGGELAIESQPGKGTTIRGCVPIVPRATLTRAG